MLMHTTTLLGNGTVPRVNRAATVSTRPAHIAAMPKVDGWGWSKILDTCGGMLRSIVFFQMYSIQKQQQAVGQINTRRATMVAPPCAAAVRW